MNTEQFEELDFEELPESKQQQKKRELIEKLLTIGNGKIPLAKLRELAASDNGLVSDKLRSRLWPQLVGVDVACLENTAGFEVLQKHPEYNQVVLDVNRSLKRFPPGIPYEQRIALQDQLTVLILRVINKYPTLKYYQGYHDVAVTVLLVAGDEAAFAIMDKLSTKHFAECMEETMDATERRLRCIWPLVKFENETLFNFLQKSNVGTLFALPWYLTWFGHNLKSYKAVVRLYDYFLASPIYSSLFVSAAIILHRANDILAEECDMPSMHCLLSKLPNNLPIEDLLKISSNLYKKYPMFVIQKEVEKLIQQEKNQTQMEKQISFERIQKNIRNSPRNKKIVLHHWFSQFLTPKVVISAAFSLIIGVCAHYYKNRYISPGIS